MSIDLFSILIGATSCREMLYLNVGAQSQRRSVRSVVYSHDVTATVLVSRNDETAVMLEGLNGVVPFTAKG